MTKIDLHIHSTMSDGSLTPKQIIDEAYKNGVKFLAITDHDTTAGLTPELFDYAKKFNIKIIPGVEVSTRYNRKGFHILGYNFDLNNQPLKDLLERVRNTRKKYLVDVNEKLSELGFYLNFDELKKVESVTKANIALDIVSNERNKEKLIEMFGRVPLRGEFIEAVMNEGKPAYVKKESILPSDAGNAIRQAGGKVVLAHPVVYDRKDGVQIEMLEEVIDNLKPDGIEANYIYFDKANNRFDDIEKWKNFAKQHNLFETVGSDFHLDDGVRAKIGFVNENLILDDKMVEKILKNLGVVQNFDKEKE